MAIIDILQPYNWRKMLENKYKKLFENEDALSCVEPHKYGYSFLYGRAAVRHVYVLVKRAVLV